LVLFVTPAFLGGGFYLVDWEMVTNLLKTIKQMKTAAFIICYTPTLKDPNFNLVRSRMLKREIDRIAFKNKMKIFPPFNMSFYQQDDKFLRNITTIKLEFELYKAPRFINR
jgi:hypothetical protein